MATERITFAEEVRTKECPFCAEVIQLKAVKCRYCGEFLNTRKAKHLLATVEHEDEDDSAQEEEFDIDEVLFEGTPSLLGLGRVFVKAAVVGAAGVALAEVAIEGYFNTWFKIDMAAGLLDSIAQYRAAVGLGIAALAACMVVIKAMKLRMTHYEVTADRIEYTRGIFDRRVDNIDMFRVLDLRLYRSLFDCLVGIGTVALVTNDQTDPDFVFEKLHRPRELYDIIKKASLEADRRNNVVHLEN